MKCQQVCNLPIDKTVDIGYFDPPYQFKKMNITKIITTTDGEKGWADVNKFIDTLMNERKSK